MLGNIVKCLCPEWLEKRYINAFQLQFTRRPVRALLRWLLWVASSNLAFCSPVLQGIEDASCAGLKHLLLGAIHRTLHNTKDAIQVPPPYTHTLGEIHKQHDPGPRATHDRSSQFMTQLFLSGSLQHFQLAERDEVGCLSNSYVQPYSCYEVACVLLDSPEVGSRARGMGAGGGLVLLSGLEVNLN